MAPKSFFSACKPLPSRFGSLLKMHTLLQCMKSVKSRSLSVSFRLERHFRLRFRSHKMVVPVSDEKMRVKNHWQTKSFVPKILAKLKCQSMSIISNNVKVAQLHLGSNLLGRKEFERVKQRLNSFHERVKRWFYSCNCEQQKLRELYCYFSCAEVLLRDLIDRKVGKFESLRNGAIKLRVGLGTRYHHYELRWKTFWEVRG